MANSVTVTIDRDDCIACASCWELCPDVFEEGDDGLSQLLNEFRSDGNLGKGQVPDNLEGCAQDAADSCPVEIIHVETS